MAQFTFYPESLDDRSFSFRIKGLNTDFMTYFMLALANYSKEALLSPETFMSLANQTFGVFFKHFVTGGNAYQPIGEKFPWSLGPVIEDYDDYTTVQDQGFLGSRNSRLAHTPTVNVTFQIPVEQLVMSPTAVYLCLSLLAFLMIVTVVMYTFSHEHYKKLPRNVDTLANTLAFVHGSEQLLAWAANAPPIKPWYKAVFSRGPGSEAARDLFQVGPFRGFDGSKRWGVELIDTMSQPDRLRTESTIELLELRPREEHTASRDGDVALETIELLERHSQEEYAEDCDGSSATNANLLGNFEWEAHSTPSTYSWPTTSELQKAVHGLKEAEPAPDGLGNGRSSLRTLQ